jgi:hypothetical protein
MKQVKDSAQNWVFQLFSISTYAAVTLVKRIARAMFNLQAYCKQNSSIHINVIE